MGAGNLGSESRFFKLLFPAFFVLLKGRQHVLAPRNSFSAKPLPRPLLRCLAVLLWGSFWQPPMHVFEAATCRTAILPISMRYSFSISILNKDRKREPAAPLNFASAQPVVFQTFFRIDCLSIRLKKKRIFNEINTFLLSALFRAWFRVLLRPLLEFS